MNENETTSVDTLLDFIEQYEAQKSILVSVRDMWESVLEELASFHLPSEGVENNLAEVDEEIGKLSALISELSELIAAKTPL